MVLQAALLRFAWSPRHPVGPGGWSTRLCQPAAVSLEEFPPLAGAAFHNFIPKREIFRRANPDLASVGSANSAARANTQAGKQSYQPGNVNFGLRQSGTTQFDFGLH
jgi:hypothetical protein